MNTSSAFMPVIGREKQCQSDSMQFINICVLSFTSFITSESLGAMCYFI